MSVEAGIELHELIDIDAPLVCEVVWHVKDEGKPCNRKASWQGDAHDEVTNHDWSRILLCGRCVSLAKMKNPCDCGEIVIRNIRRL